MFGASLKALKDAKRETIFVNDNIFMGNAEKLMRRLQSLVLPLVGGKEENLASAVCKDIIRASSRTAGGGDAYSAVYSIFKQSNDGYMLAPKAAEGKPIIVVVDGERGEVCMYHHSCALSTQLLLPNHFCVGLFDLTYVTSYYYYYYDYSTTIMMHWMLVVVSSP